MYQGIANTGIFAKCIGIARTVNALINIKAVDSVANIPSDTCTGKTTARVIQTFIDIIIVGSVIAILT